MSESSLESSAASTTSVSEFGAEINRLVELMPASGRMYCKIISDPNQPTVIFTRLPRPDQDSRPIRINFDLWQKLSLPQRDLLLLRAASRLTSIQWFKPELYQGLAAAGAAFTLLEVLLGNAAGIVTFSGLTTLAVAQIWRKNRSSEAEMIVDEKAIQVAQRRGYKKAEATEALIAAIEAVAEIEQRSLSVTELLRCQNLRATATDSVL
ncbi:MAG: DUF3318 domain-containing protein [Pegethrix bostrychoides GSE-TBD4-15B]|jgi:hypothetical protein|uniref:DUF3318 domain-containing protein n=1 Tax=Pegethrix bostrychoides GSE-TBD4-15B TaxID=2839662 RepID=A0A951U684_9CYAN|nr:DUF3318 domain-containing protein [Pegethrix bostrychoides GSE-TBD4-15B]